LFLSASQRLSGEDFSAIIAAMHSAKRLHGSTLATMLLSSGILMAQAGGQPLPKGARPGQALASRNDAFLQRLLGQTYQKLGKKDKAVECCRNAAATAAHNPSAAYARPFAPGTLSD
jgi:hypothetical protein